MGKIIHITKLKEFIRNTPAFRAKDVEVLIRNKNYAHLILHKLVKRGEIKRVVKGWYSLYEDPVVAVFCFKPCYLGLQEALSLHNLWEQETNVVIITTRKVRRGVRKIFDNNVVLHKIDKKYFFGFDFMEYENFFIPVSDIEKTLIDLVYFNEVPSEEVLKEIKKKLDLQKLKNYLKVFNHKFKKRVMDLI